MIVSPEQIRAARALLRLEQDEIARRAHVSVITIRRLEAAHGADRVAAVTLDQVRQVLEQAGAIFIENGVRLRRAGRSQTSTLFGDLRAISLRSAERQQGHDRINEADLYDADGLPA